MSDIELSKLYYQNRDAYEKIYQERFASVYTVRLNFNINGNPAFFERTPEIMEMLTNILRWNGEVSKLCVLLPGAALDQFARRCLIDEIVLTNGIEGVRSTRREISDILDELETNNRRQRFYGLVRNYQTLMKRERVSLENCQDIRKIYDELVLDEVRAENPKNIPDGRLFRKNSVSVYSPSQKEIHRGAYPESRIIEQMEQALAFLNGDSCDILYRIAAFHYLLEYIHPFYDGNGRLGRFICSYLLSRELAPVTGYRISYTIREQINEYYHAFDTCNDSKNRGDMTPFVRMFMNIIQISVGKLKESLQEGYDRLTRCMELIPEFPESGESKMEELYYLLLQAALFSEYGISTKEILNYLGVSYDTLKRKLARIPPEYLKKRKQKTALYYSLNMERIENL